MSTEKSQVNSGPSTPVAIRHNFSPMGDHKVESSLGSVIELVPEQGATKLLIQALAQNVRYTLSVGVSPVAGATGFLLLTTEPPVIIEVIRGVTITVVEETASAVLQLQWGR